MRFRSDGKSLHDRLLRFGRVLLPYASWPNVWMRTSTKEATSSSSPTGPSTAVTLDRRLFALAAEVARQQGGEIRVAP